MGEMALGPWVLGSPKAGEGSPSENVSLGGGSGPRLPQGNRRSF